MGDGGASRGNVCGFEKAVGVSDGVIGEFNGQRREYEKTKVGMSQTHSAHL